MARISSEQAVSKVGNRYDLILIASLRARQLKDGHKPKMPTKLGNTLTALTEIENGLIGREYLKYYKEEKNNKNRDNTEWI